MLNVLLGEELLPVGHDSATSVLCEICYTEKRDEKAAIVYLRKGSKERKQKLNLCDAKDRSLFQDYLLNGRDSSKHPKDANEEEDCFRVEMLLHLDFLQVSYILYSSCKSASCVIKSTVQTYNNASSTSSQFSQYISKYG